MELGLRGRTAIVCGASQGMGLAIAEALASDRAAYVTGTVVPVDGGLTRGLL